MCFSKVHSDLKISPPQYIKIFPIQWSKYIIKIWRIGTVDSTQQKIPRLEYRKNEDFRNRKLSESILYEFFRNLCESLRESIRGEILDLNTNSHLEVL